LLALAALSCGFGAGWCMMEVTKKAEEHDKRSELRLDGTPGQPAHAGNHAWHPVFGKELPG
jgi:hypothetical protein